MKEKDVVSILKSFGIKQYNYELCKKCQGQRCCQHFGCSYTVDDFEVLNDESCDYRHKLKKMIDFLKLGYASIDMICYNDVTYGPLNPFSLKPDIDKISNNDGFLFLRARNKDRPVVDFQFFLGENQNYPCASWSLENGCAFENEKRPSGGRLLIPMSGDNCVDLMDYDEMVEGWAKHKLLMYDLYRHVRSW